MSTHCRPSTQHTDGSWDGSAYSTALAIRLLNSSGVFNWSMSGLTAQPSAPLDGQQVQLKFNVLNNGSIVAPAAVARVFDGNPLAGGLQIGSDISVPALAVGDNPAEFVQARNLDDVMAKC